jgi:two-component system, NtrC family, response regulator GlrR
MGNARIVIIEDASTDGLGAQVRAILSGHFGALVDLVKRGRSGDIEGIAADPDLIVPVMPSRANEAATLLTRLQSRQAAQLLVVRSADLTLVPDEHRSWTRDFLVAPFAEAEVLHRARRLIALGTAGRGRGTSRPEGGDQKLIGEAPAFLRVKQKLFPAARSDAPVLLTGETGTGKEVFARTLHYLSSRSDKPFLPVNCGAIPVELFESELFGHEKGAFTGAVTSRPGLIAEADGGTLFLDEIETLSLRAQAKLLRFLEDQTYHAVGSSRTTRADVRIIAATNVELTLEARAGRFRDDLYYRLAVLALTLPALRERPTDIPLLVDHFWAEHAGLYGADERKLSDRALQAMCLYGWPGNVRQLLNVIRQVLILTEARVIEPENLPIPVAPLPETNGGVTMQEAKALVVKQFEREYISALLKEHGGNVTRAAQAAGKDRRAFGRLVKKHHLGPS